MSLLLRSQVYLSLIELILLFVRNKDVIVKYSIFIYCHTQNYEAEKEEILTVKTVSFLIHPDNKLLLFPNVQLSSEH